MPVGSDRSGGYEDSTEYGEGAGTAAPAASKAYEALVVAAGGKAPEQDPSDDERDRERQPPEERAAKGEGPTSGAGWTPHPDEVAAPLPDPETPEAERKLGLKRVWKRGVGAALIVVVVAIGGVVASRGGGSDDHPSTSDAPATQPVVADPNAPVQPPDPSKLPPGAVLYQGSAGPIGCVPCDGKFRLLHPTNGGVVADKLGSPAEAGQAMAFPANGKITEFGINLTKADGGKWEFALHANGNAYVASCHIPVGSTRCKTKGLDNAPIKADDKIAVIVGNPGDPLTQGQFNASWWIVFQPS